MRRLGAHVTTAGGLGVAISRAQDIGANCLQIFSSPPQQWQMSKHTDIQLQQFRDQTISSNVLPVFIHGTYLINLASDNADLVEKSIQSLVADLHFCDRIGGGGVIFHLGTHPLGWTGKKRDDMMKAFKRIFAATPSNTILAVENSAGSGTSVAGKLEVLAEIQADLAENRLRFCIDTAHAFAHGYDISTVSGCDTFISSVDSSIGWASVVAIHLNDSKVPCGSRRDRHENIGEGEIGTIGFKHLLNNPKIVPVPLILETPGFDNTGPDKKNIDRVNGLIREQN